MDRDYWIERRQLRRRVSWWRALTFIVLILLVIGIGVYASGSPVIEQRVAHIAKVKISGLITGDDATIKLLRDVGESNAKAAIITIESPGGTVTGSEALYDALRKLSAKKPTVAVIDGMAASGGYIAAIGTDHLIARETSLVGSIGVLFQYPDIVRMLDSIGVKVESIKSSPLKAAPSPIESATPESRAAIAALVSANYDWFKNLVKERRRMDDTHLSDVSDGRVFTGKQGVDLGLIDELGAEDQAIKWLETTKGVAKGLPVREWRPHGFAERFGLAESASAFFQMLGLTESAGVLEAVASASRSHMLDGMLVLWHP
jgi:protease IV